MAVAGVSGGGTTADAGRTRLADSYQTFMSLLTAQIQNQDPLSPMDSTQFTQQLVQMTGVEQQLLTNDLLGKLVTNTGSGIQTSVSLLGREVRAIHDEAKLMNGEAKWSYKLDREASDVTIQIVNDKGAIVRTMKAPAGGGDAGDHNFTWDGKDNEGHQLANGKTYTMKVIAKDSEGATVPSTNFIRGVVTGVEQLDGKTYITVNGTQVGWETVTSIADVTPPPAQQAANNNNQDEEKTPS